MESRAQRIRAKNNYRRKICKGLRKPRPDIRIPMEALENTGRKRDRSDKGCDRADKKGARLKTANRIRLESGRYGRDGKSGSASLPLPVSILCGRRQTLLPAISKIVRHISRRAVQYRVLFPTHNDDSAGVRAF